MSQGSSAAPRGIFANSLWNMLSFGVAILIVGLTTPLYLRYLGLDQFGILSLMIAITAPLGIMNAGISQATIKYVAEYSSQRNLAKCALLVRTNYTINLGFGLLGALLLLGCSQFLAIRAFKLDSKLYADATLSFALVGIVWLLAQAASSFRGAVEGFRDYRQIAIGSSTLLGVTNALGLMAVVQLPLVSTIIACQIVVGFLGLFYWFREAKKRIPSLSLLPALNGPSLRQTWAFSSWQILNSIFGTAAGVADKYLIGGLMNSSALGSYSVAQKLQDPSRSLFTTVLVALFPAISSVSHKDGEAEKIILLWAWRISFCCGLLLMCAIVLGTSFLNLWVGKEVAERAGPVLVVLLMTLLLELPSALLGQYILAIGLPKWNTLINIFTSILTIVLMYLLLGPFGIMGVAWAGFLGLLVTRIPFHIWIYRQSFRGKCALNTFLHAFYGVLLSLGLGGLLSVVLQRLIEHRLGLLVGFAVSVIGLPIAVALTAALSEIVIFRNRGAVADLVWMLAGKARGLLSRTP